MARRKLKTKEYLTDLELRVMTLFWNDHSRESLSVHDLLEEMNKSEEKYCYTTISTIVRLLEKRGHISGEKKGRGHVYRAELLKEKYQKIGLNSLLRSLFDGTPVSLVKRLFEENELSEYEKSEIKKLLN